MAAARAVAALAALCCLGMLALPSSRPTVLMDRFPQAMLAEIPGRGLVELVPEISVPRSRQQMLLSGIECKQKCYDNFIMCGDHRLQTDSKITKFNYADATHQCRFLKSNCEAMC